VGATGFLLAVTVEARNQLPDVLKRKREEF
jgi:hypothetical protein